MIQKLKKIDSFIVTFLAIISTWIILGAVPKLQMTGMYRQVETQILFLHSIGGLLFFYQSLKFIFFKDEKNKLSNILFLLPFLIGLLSLVFSIFTQFTFVTLLGSPQIGQGAFWYLDLSIMVLVFSSTLMSIKVRKIIFINCLLMTSIITFFTINPFWKNLPISFFYFNDYLCYFGVLNFILFTTIFKNKYYLGAGFITLGFYLSILDNKAAQALWLITLLIGLIYFLILKIERVKIFRFMKNFFYSDYFLATSVVILYSVIIFSSLIFWPGKGQLSSEIASSPISSLVVRGKIAEVALSNLFSFKSMIVGFGWGNVPDLLVSKMNVWQFDQLTVGYNLHFHTHNELFEHFISIGLAGLFLFLLYIFFTFRCSSTYSIYTKLGWLLFFYISCFWFFWAGTLPIIALALATLDSDTIKNSNNSRTFINKIQKVPNYFISILFIFFSGVLFYGAWLTYLNSNNYKIITYNQLLELANSQSTKNLVCKNIYDDKRGGYTIAPFLYNFSRFIVKNNLVEDANNIKVVKVAQCLAHEKIFSNKASLQLLSSSILADSNLYFIEDKTKRKNIVSNENFTVLKKKVEILMKKAPKRGDLIIPFIAMSLEAGKINDIRRLCVDYNIVGVENICFLIEAYSILEFSDIDNIKIKKSISLLKKAVQTGILEEKVYGWWLDSKVAYQTDGYGKNGIPLSPDIIFLIAQKEEENIYRILNNYR